MGVHVKFESTMPKFAKSHQKRKTVKFSRLEYSALAQVCRIMILKRTIEYHLDCWGEPFEPYTAQTLRKKKSSRGSEIINEEYERMTVILRKLADRMRSGRAKPDEIKSLRASMGHFRSELNKLANEFYASPAMKADREAVNLTDSGKMLHGLQIKGTLKFAEVVAPEKAARLISKGVTHQRYDEKKRRHGTLPARPFVGLSNREREWIRREFVEPIMWNYIQFVIYYHCGGDRPEQLVPSQIANKMLRKIPTRSDEMRRA